MGFATKLGAAALVSCLALAGGSAPASAANIRDHRSPSTGPGQYVLDGATSVFEMTLTRPPARRTLCETRNKSAPQVDPVLHVLRLPAGDGPVSEIARDDDNGGDLNARVSFSSGLTGGRFLLVLRPAGPGRGGTVDLFCDGRLVWTKVGVGGAFQRLEQLDSREELRTVTGPGGPGLHTLYLFDDSQKLLARYVSGPTDTAFVAGGLTGLRVALVGGRWPDPPGELRLVRNDVRLSGRDPDGDGLGARLEAAIGTCSSRQGVAQNFDCSRAADPRDTDGDGLPDGLEVLGKLTSTPVQHLPRWGADPRHKDLFVEVDFGQQAMGEPIQKMSPREAGVFMGIYADPETSPLLQLLHAQQLVNPDLKPGVNTHLDIGVNPPAGSAKGLLTTYGDWGGFSVAPPDCDAGGACRRRAAGEVYDTLMDPARRGIFHYALGDPGGGGQAGRGIALNFPMGSGLTAAHEFGHTLGLNHEGRPPGVNCTPAYPSLMSYAFIDHIRPPTFSDGYGRAAVNGFHLKETGFVPSPGAAPNQRYLAQLVEAFGYNVDTAAGHVDWNRDGAYSAAPVRAYASNAIYGRGGCELTRDSQMEASGLSRGAPALTRLNDRVLLFYIDESSRKLRLDQATTDLACPGLAQSCGGLQARTVAGAWNREMDSVDAQALATTTGPQVLVVYRSGGGVFETILRPNGLFSRPRQIVTGAVGEVSLTGKDGRAWLAYRNGAGAVFLKARDAGGAWGPDEEIVATPATALRLADAASPAILLVTDKTGQEDLLGAFATSGGLSLYHRAPGAPGPWAPYLARPAADPVLGRPALAFEPVDAASPLPGKVRLLYVRNTAAPATVVMQAELAARGVGPAAQPIFLTAQHDNDWFYGTGVDLLFEPGVDTNLRAAIATALIERGEPSPHRVLLRPKADGVVDFEQKNFSDWEMFAATLCSTLKAAGAGVDCQPEP